MAVQFAQPYRFTEPQLAAIAADGLIPAESARLIDGIPYAGGLPVHFSWQEYQRLGEIGVLGEDERVELIHGEVIRMPPVGGTHHTIVRDLDDYLRSLVSPGQRVLTQLELRVGELEPVPDLIVLDRAREVRGEVSSAEGCCLVVEVAQSSRRFDRIVKRELYASGGIPEYWVVDVVTRTVVVHRKPVAGDFGHVAEHGAGDTFCSPALGGREVPVDRLLI